MLLRIGVGGSQERHAVERVDRVLVGVVGQQDLAGLGLAALHRALDLRCLEQRRVGVHGDAQLAAGGRLDVLGELGDVLGVVVGRRGGRGQVPFDLLGERGTAAKGQRGDRRHRGAQEGLPRGGCLRDANGRVMHERSSGGKDEEKNAVQPTCKYRATIEVFPYGAVPAAGVKKPPGGGWGGRWSTGGSGGGPVMRLTWPWSKRGSWYRPGRPCPRRRCHRSFSR